MKQGDSSDNPKARGLKHVKNKKKYKPGGHSGLPKPKPKAQPALDSNWDRYEQSEPENRAGSDFSILANAPITQGSHFQFKSDKGIAQDIDFDKSLELFNLDLRLLDKSLATISFCQRSEIEDKHFTENQQRIMASTVKTNLENYKSYVETHFSKTVESVFDSECESENSHSQSEGEEDFDDIKVQTELFERDATHGDSNVTQNSPRSAENDLEQWLDDILDD